MFGMIAEMGAFILAGHVASKTAARMGLRLAAAGIEKGGAKSFVKMLARGEKQGLAAGSVVRKYLKAQGSPLMAGAGAMNKRSMSLVSDLISDAAQYRGWQAANAMMWAVPMMGLGGELLGGLGDLAARAPKPSEQMQQTQQFMLPRAAYTQRQRALQAIHSSQMTTRAAIGNEAQFLHR